MPSVTVEGFMPCVIMDGFMPSPTGELDKPVTIQSFCLQKCMNPSITSNSIWKHPIKEQGLVKAKFRLTKMGENNIMSDSFLFVKVYASYDRVANQIFEESDAPNGFAWTSTIALNSKNWDAEKVIHVYKEMLWAGVVCNKSVFLHVLKSCITLNNLEQGIQVHADTVKCGLELDIIVASNLINMYAKCWKIENANRVFNKMQERNLVVWNTIISGYAQQGYGEEAVTLFFLLQKEGIKPNEITFVSFIKACASIGALDLGRKAHEQIIRNFFDSNSFVGCALVYMYATCSSLEDAHRVFGEITERDVVSWNAMIVACSQRGFCEEALALFDKMQEEGPKPGKVTFVNALKACPGPSALEHGRKIHAQILRSGFQECALVANALVDMYARCGNLDDASRVFQRVHCQDLVSWNTLIAGYAQKGLGMDALNVFNQMKQEGLRPDEITFASVVNACAKLADLVQGLRVHAEIIQCGYQWDVFVGSALVDMYAKCDMMDVAKRVFNEMSSRNVVSWNAMITGYVQRGLEEEALCLFQEMKLYVVPDVVTYVNILKACASLTSLDLGRHIHAEIIEIGFYTHSFIGSTLVDTYGKCGSINDVQRVFNGLREQDIVSWSAMIAGYAQQGLGHEVLKLFKQMQQEGFSPNEVTFTSVLSGCSHSGLVNEGLEYFESMVEKHGILPTADHYACVVGLLSRAGYLEEAKEFVKNMPFTPSEEVWMSLLSACCIYGNVELARYLLEQVLELNPENAAAYVLLSNLYATAIEMI